MTPILGTASVTAHQAHAWADGHDCAPVFHEVIDALYAAADKTEVRADVLVAQSAHETGFARFGRALTPEHHNTCGLKVPHPVGPDDNPDDHERFPSWQAGAEAHANHLRWPYCGRDPIGVVAPRSQHTATASWAGTVTTVEGLSTKWAPSTTYHTKIVAYLEEMEAMTGSITIVLRHEWGARNPRSRHRIDTPTPELWLHHTAGVLDANGNGVWWDDMRGIQDFHMDGRGWSDIAYSFVIGGGQIFEGRGAGIAGGHTKGHNTISHAICLIGDYTWMKPRRHDIEAIARLLAHGHREGWWPAQFTGGHRDASGASTACPGNNLAAALPDINALARHYLTPTPTEEDEMFDEIVRLHEFYLGAPADKRPRQWNDDLKKSLDHHYTYYAGGRPLADIVGDFRSTAGYV